MDFTLEEQRLIGIAVCFMRAELRGELTTQKDLMESELPFVMKHEKKYVDILKKVEEGCRVSGRML